MKNNINLESLNVQITVIFLLCLLGSTTNSPAFARYRDPVTGSGNCSDCHGSFTDSTSPKGTVFPSNSKHEMHRATTSMDTACNLCHSTSDNRNPYIYTSTGAASNAGLGCSGCHVAAGLRAHHAANGVDVCGDCHVPEAPEPENVKPPYYGTGFTKVDHPDNLISRANTNENWSVGDFIGLDNDGNNLYDAADFACGPYRILSATVEGGNVRITWLTAGGRKDAVQAADSPSGPYTNIAAPVAIPGVGIVTTNRVDIASTNRSRFYHISYQP
jgi:hypothetical protein